MMGLGRLVQRATVTDIAPVVGGPTYETGVNGLGSLPAQYWGLVGGDQMKTYPITASGEGALTALSAAWRCLHILSDGIGALELFAYDDEADDRRVDTPRVLSDPWPVMSPVEWRAMCVSSLVVNGNLYLLPYDIDPRTGYPRQLAIVHPDRVKVVLESGRPSYYIDDQWVSAVDVLHIRGYMPPGAIVGIGIVEAMRRGIQLATDLDRYQMGNLEGASVPPAIIRVNRPEISQEQANDIQQRWIARHGFGNRTPAVLPTSLNVETIAWSPEDTQFLESKQYQAVEICWWFGIDPRVLGLSASGQSLTYSNVESTYVDLQRMSFMPWTSRLESSLSRVMPRRLMARFDYSPMLRTTLQDRYSAYATALESGWLTIEEVRSLENMGPLGSDVDVSRPGPVTGMREQVNNTLPTATEAEVVA